MSLESRIDGLEARIHADNGTIPGSTKPAFTRPTLLSGNRKNIPHPFGSFTCHPVSFGPSRSIAELPLNPGDAVSSETWPS